MRRHLPTNQTVQQTISCAMLKNTMDVNLPIALDRDGVQARTLSRLRVSAWMNQHSSRDSVTEWIWLGLSMDEEDAGLHDDDRPSPPEEADATATSGLEDQTAGSHESED